MKYLMNDLRILLINLFYFKWQKIGRDFENGYTALIPTPSDLPIFLDLTLEIISRQNKNSLQEIIIVPDWPSKKFEAYFEQKIKLSQVPIRLINLRLKDKLAWRFTKSITTRHFTQLIRAVDAVKTKYAIIHDADLFLPPGDFLFQQYLYCTQNQLNVFGLDTRRSLSRFDYKEFVATWEMMFSTEWFRSFAPSKHKGQFVEINGRRQEFDTTSLPQYLTDPKTVAWKDRSNEYFHFSFVIASYRNFMNKKEWVPAYSLNLFLIRTLVDASNIQGWEYNRLPNYKDFLDGKFGLKELIESGENGKRLLREFFHKIEGILTHNILPSDNIHFIQSRVDELKEAITRLESTLKK
jgi:hypothetical protein